VVVSPAIVLAQIRAAQTDALNVDLRGHADETRQAIYQARIALYRAEDILAARAGETLTRGTT
jgi:hypothetical protein